MEKKARRSVGWRARMVCKFVNEGSKDWHKWLPFLLFTICKVPQASLGFSPFELLHGRHPRGILDVVREDWEEGVQEQPFPLSLHCSTERQAASCFKPSQGEVGDSPTGPQKKV